MRVFVYYNLHKHVFSIRAQEGPDKGRVIAHATSVALSDVKFEVGQIARERVVRERCKSVHAGAKGVLESFLAADRGSAPFPASEGRRPQAMQAGQQWLRDIEALSYERMQAHGWIPVTYDPYRWNSFVTHQWHEPVLAADRVVLRGKLAWIHRASEPPLPKHQLAAFNYQEIAP